MTTNTEVKKYVKKSQQSKQTFLMILKKYLISVNSFCGNYSFLNLALCTVPKGNEETICRNTVVHFGILIHVSSRRELNLETVHKCLLGMLRFSDELFDTLLSSVFVAVEKSSY